MSGPPTTALLRARVLPQCAAQQRPSSTPASTPRGTGVAGRRLADHRPSVPHASTGLRAPETLERPAQHDNIQSSRREAQAVADRGAADTPTEAAAAAAAGGGATAELLPKLSLLGAAALWGSYAPSVRLLYESANPPDAVVVMAARGLLQSLVLLGASLALQRATDGSGSSNSSSSPSSDSADASSSTNGSSGNALQDWLFLRSPKLWQAALELGFFNYSATALQVRRRCFSCWLAMLAASGGAAAGRRQSTVCNQPGGTEPRILCLGGLVCDWPAQPVAPPQLLPSEQPPPPAPAAAVLQTLGLQLVGATRASFLVQATVLLTPLLSTLAGYRPGRRVWAACGMALFGCLLITADEATAEASSGASLAAAGLHLGEGGKQQQQQPQQPQQRGMLAWVSAKSAQADG